MPTISGEPELESVTKQFLYRTAFRALVENDGVDNMVNAFLLPSPSAQVEILGTVKFPVVTEVLEPPATNEISVWSLPAEKVLRSIFEPADADGNLRTMLDLVASSDQ